MSIIYVKKKHSSVTNGYMTGLKTWLPQDISKKNSWPWKSLLTFNFKIIVNQIVITKITLNRLYKYKSYVVMQSLNACYIYIKVSLIKKVLAFSLIS